MSQASSIERQVVISEPRSVQLIDRIQGELASLRTNLRRPTYPLGKSDRSAIVRGIIRARRERDACFGDIFADPAWDVLLALYAARLAQHKVQTSALCHAAAVPPTTALRWIDRLDQNEWIVRTQDPLDARRVFVELSDKGLTAMQGYFDGLADDLPI